MGLLLRGLFITLEGGEGSGKTTLLKKIADALTFRGFEVVATREPGGTKLGDHIRHCLLDPEFKAHLGQNAELLLFLAARLQHIDEVILPALEKGKIVLCDRFNDSTIAYQGMGRGLGLEYTETLCHLVCHGLTPDLTLFMDVDPAEGLRRTKGIDKEQARAGQVDRIEAEALEFHEKVRNAFYSLARRYPERIRVLDANRPREVVQEQAMELIHSFVTSISSSKG